MAELDVSTVASRINALTTATTTGGTPPVVDAPTLSSSVQGLPQVTKLLDMDTVLGSDGGGSYRLQGFDAAEVGKWLTDKSTGKSFYKSGTAGGMGSLKAFEQFMADNGPFYIKDMGKGAAYGRKTGRLIDSQGRDVIEMMMVSGVVQPTIGATPEQVADVAWARFARSNGRKDPNQDKYDALAEQVNEAMTSEGFNPNDFKREAINEAEYSTDPNKFAKHVVKFRRNDRDLMNQAYSPFSSSFGTALVGVKESGYGFSSMIGKSLGLKELENWGEAGVYRAGDEISRRAETLLDYKDVDSVGDAFEFVGNNMAMSLPYMATTMASIAASGITGGASLTVPASLYTGAVWNEQADDAKSASLAIAGGVMQGVIDIFGGKMLLGSFGKSKTPKSIVKKGFEELKRLGVSEEAALNMSKQQLAKLSTSMADIVKTQIRSRERIGEILAGSAVGAGSEAITEATQELIGYTAAHVKDDSFQFDDALERMISAAVAGGSIGGTFSGAGSLWDQAKVEQAAWSGGLADGSGTSGSGVYEQQELDQFGKVNTNSENADEARFKAKSQTNSTDSFLEKGERGDRDAKVNNLSDLLWKGVSEIPGLWRGSTRNAFTETLKSQSRAVRKLADMFGGNLQRTFSGADFETYKRQLVAKYENIVGNSQESYAILNNGKVVTAKARSKISDNLYAIGQAAVNKDGTPNLDKIPEVIARINKEREVSGLDPIDPELAGEYSKVLANAERAAQTMWSDQNQYYEEQGSALGKVNNYLSTFKSLDKAAVAKDQVEFKRLLKKNYRNLSDKAVNDIVDNILENPLKADIDGLLDGDGAFSVTKGTPIPGSHKSRSLGLAKNIDFKNFMERDFFVNADYASKAASRYQSYQKFVGMNGSVINQLLNEAKAEGVAKEDIDKLARQMRDYLDAESGNYKRATSEFGKSLQRVQKNFITFMVFVGLPLATVSSLVELVMTMQALTNEQIFGKGGLKTMGKELGNMFYNAGGEISSVVTRKEFTNRESESVKRLRELGYYDTQVGAASKTGVTETNVLRQNLLSVFFKWNGLQGWTQMTRAVRAGIAWDYMFNHLETISSHPNDQPMTNAVEEAHEHLRNLGLNRSDINRLTTLGTKVETNTATEQDMLELKDLTSTATIAFIDNAIMMPGSANRPMIYQDPRFALFTQFSGFISVLQSTFIPKLWGNYVKRGSPEMTYQAFSMMVLMITMGFASQELKDRLKFGGENPYLDGFEKGRRAINSSGLLGTGERVVNTIFPMYESRSDNAADWVVGEFVGQSPVLGSIANLISGGSQMMQQNYKSGVNKLLKVTPIGPFTWLRNIINETLTGDDNDWKTGG